MSASEASQRSNSPDSLLLLAQRAVDLLGSRNRILIGIAGSPGAGKTTLARNVADQINKLIVVPESLSVAVVLPMDGYHLANSMLDALGRHERKGAIDTFDGWGFLALLRRIISELDHTVYAPSFDRIVDEGVAGSIGISGQVRVVIVEGNYLLIDDGPWAHIPQLFAETWFCETLDEERLERLVDRHTRHGRSAEQALDWATTVDGKNAALIQESSSRATLRVSGVTAAILS